MNELSKQQLNIINAKPDENIIVSAAAGSGKTRVLVERIIDLIVNDKYRLKDMLIMTFTIAATGEMKQRIKEAIDIELEKPDITNTKRKKLIEELALLQNANISTIDSFCKKILMENYHLLNESNCIYGEFDPAYRIANEKELQILYENALDDFLEKKYADVKYKELFDLYFVKTDDSRLRNLLLNGLNSLSSKPWPKDWILMMISKHDELANEALDKYIEKTSKDLFDFKYKLPEIKEKFDTLISLLKKVKNVKCDEVVDSINNIYIILSECANYEPTKENAKRLKDKITEEKFKFPLKEIYAAIKIDEDDFVKNYRKPVEEIIKEFTGFVDYAAITVLADKYKINSIETLLLKLLLEYYEHIVHEKRRKNLYAISDYQKFALDILYDSVDGKRVLSEKAKEIAEKYSLIFVDEYQDTSPAQDKIIEAIRNGRKNLFLVGDMKQSIYAFRNAEPRLFKEKIDNNEFKNEFLGENYRSQNKILRFVNKIFENVMYEEFGGIDYKNNNRLEIPEKYITVEPEKHEGPKVEVSLILGKDKVKNENQGGEKNASTFTAGEYEAEYITERVKKLHDEEHYDYKDIMILARGYSKFPDIINALSRNNIPCYAIQKEGFYGQQEINLAVDMLSVIDNSLQDIPLANVLLSEIFSITENELAFIRLENSKNIYGGKREKLNRIIDGIYYLLDEKTNLADDYKKFNIKECDLKEKLNKFITIYSELTFKARYLSISELINLMYEKTYMKDIVGSMPGGLQRIANLDTLYENAKDYENTSYVGLFNFLRYIEKIKTSKQDQGLANISTKEDDVVKMTVIHQSKGLQYKVVILCGNHGAYKIKNCSTTTNCIYDNKYGVSLNYYDKDDNLIYYNPKRSLIIESNKDNQKQEEIRLLYVALTRAVDKLIITGFAAGEDLGGSNYKKKDITTIPTNICDVKNANCYFDLIIPNIEHKETNDYIYKEIPAESFDDKLMIASDKKKYIRKFTLKTNLLKNDIDYAYKNLQNIKPKISVTELKESVNDKKYENVLSEAYYENKDLNEQEVKKLVANERGNAYHRYMEFFDFSKKSYDEHGESEYVNYSCIDKDKIDKLLDSDIGKLMCKAYEEKRLFREHKFMKLISTNDINKYKNTDSLKGEVFDDKNIVIQGIIDAFIVNSDNTITVIDYKTDMMDSKKNADDIKKQLISNYKTQLEVYSDVLEETTRMRIKDRIIWSFALNDSISLM